MKEADGIATTKHEDKKSLIAISRQTVQTAEDAREIAVKRIDSERAEYERNASARREANANNQASLESQRRVNAEAVTADAVRQRDDADRNNRNAQADTLQAQNAQADAVRQRDDADRNNVNAQANTLQAQNAQADAVRQRDDADRNNREAQANTLQARNAQASAEAESERNRAAAASSDQQLQQSLRDREVLRARILQQLNLILETRDTARGLVVNMSDVLFDSGKFTLRPLAREKLAKISGIVLANPSLKLAVEGNTDSIGSEESNQRLSQRRAEGVRSYLTAQGIPEASTTATGFGKTRPIASNDTADGRQQNRRVELIVSGEVIGTKIISLTAQPVADLSPR
jgi:outer membrane protein OmpA-like peptidoglycan-associated protein